MSLDAARDAALSEVERAVSLDAARDAALSEVERAAVQRKHPFRCRALTT